MTVSTARLEDLAGDDLRAVAEYDRDGYEVVYERDDVAQKPQVIDKIHRELILDGLGVEYLEDVFQVGRLQCTMHRFERAVCMHFSKRDHSGLFVSIDRDSDVPLEEFADLCLDAAE